MRRHPPDWYEHYDETSRAQVLGCALIGMVAVALAAAMVWGIVYGVLWALS